MKLWPVFIVAFFLAMVFGIVLNVIMNWDQEKRIARLEIQVSALQDSLDQTYLNELRVFARFLRDVNLTKRVIFLQCQVSLLEAELIKRGRLPADYADGKIYPARYDMGGIGGEEK